MVCLKIVSGENTVLLHSAAVANETNVTEQCLLKKMKFSNWWFKI